MPHPTMGRRTMEPLQTNTRTISAHLSRLTPAAIPTIFGLGLATLIAVVLVASGTSPGDAGIGNGLAVVASLAAAAATLLTAISRPRGARAPWLMLGLGIFSYSLGSFLLFLRDQGPDHVPKPGRSLLTVSSERLGVAAA